MTCLQAPLWRVEVLRLVHEQKSWRCLLSWLDHWNSFFLGSLNPQTRIKEKWNRTRMDKISPVSEMPWSSCAFPHEQNVVFWKVLGILSYSANIGRCRASGCFRDTYIQVNTCFEPLPMRCPRCSDSSTWPPWDLLYTLTSCDLNLQMLGRKYETSGYAASESIESLPRLQRCLKRWRSRSSSRNCRNSSFQFNWYSPVIDSLDAPAPGSRSAREQVATTQQAAAGGVSGCTTCQHREQSIFQRLQWVVSQTRGTPSNHPAS